MTAKLEKEYSDMKIKINLKNRPVDPTVNVDLQWRIDVTEPQHGMLSRLFNNHVRVNKDVKINVEVIEVHNDIVCDKDKLFSILYNNDTIGQADFPYSVKLSSMSTPFQLLFHQSEIKDCARRQDANPRECPIEFKVELLDADDDSVIDSVRDKIIIVFEQMRATLKYNFSLNKAVQYSAALGKTKTGDFHAWIDEDFRFTPGMKMEVAMTLKKGKQELPGLVSIGEEDSSIVTFPVDPGLEKRVSLPVYVDFTTIPNPATDKDVYTIEYSYRCATEYAPNVWSQRALGSNNFDLMQDSQGTELKVLLNDVDTTTTSESVNFLPKGNMQGVVKVTLKNLATDTTIPQAGLLIKNLSVSETVRGCQNVIDSEQRPISNFLTLDGQHKDEMCSPKGYFIRNGANALTDISVKFDVSKIVDVVGGENYSFINDSILSFDYWQDPRGTQDFSDKTKKECKIHISWDMHLLPNKEWLCVDYGSSAIVCRYDKDILDLKKRKQKIFQDAKEKSKTTLEKTDPKTKLKKTEYIYEDNTEDNNEQDTKFLSSDILFNSINYVKNSKDDKNKDDKDSKVIMISSLLSELTDNPNSYLDLAVCLSPTTSLISKQVLTQLPCLKILAGNQYLPEIDYYNTFEYARKSGDSVSKVKAADAKKNEEKSCLLKISNVFKESYTSLFRYFIEPIIRGDENEINKINKINKLVLTYPNTYTPAHLKMLENIATATFPKVRPGYLKFVSESDAVAAYYIANWSRYNPGRDINRDETVLVYDMGAGTLDISLFTKKRNEQGQLEVSILGKIGTGKAGNYLDYLIGEIIRDEYPDANLNEIISTKRAAQAADYNRRVEIKDQIKQTVKPRLQPGRDIDLWISKENKITVESDVILENQRFQDYLREVTVDVLIQLLSYIGGEIKIDTVLMSGRSCRLEVLQRALRDCFRGATLLTLNNSDDRDKDKTAVVEGAIMQAAIYSNPESPVKIRSRRLYASYGLIYKDVGGRRKYAELLKGSDLGFVTDVTNLKDYKGKNVTIEGTGATDTIKLVQTYLSAENTEKAYNNCDFEFISEMEEYDMSNFENANSLNVKLQCDYKNNISLYVNGRQSQGNSPQGIDLQSEITKKSIWPVTID